MSAEVTQIASEAFLNAARHSGADNVEAVIRFGQRELALEVRDNGVGLAEELLATGHKPGHFGLVGMRERAERIGGSFVLESRPGQGSAMTLKVPEKLAYAGAQRRKPRLPFFPWSESPNHA